MTRNWERFFERLWRAGGIVFAIFFIVGFLMYRDQPKVGASTADLVSFYHGDRTRILMATMAFAVGTLFLLWFGAALSSVLRDAGKGGWGAAAIASSAATGAVLFVHMTVLAVLAFSIAGSGSPQVTSGFLRSWLGPGRDRVVPRCDVRHVWSGRAVAGGDHLEAVLLGRRTGRGARPGGGIDLGQEWLLGA
jgi:hypothetical protein